MTKQNLLNNAAVLVNEVYCKEGDERILRELGRIYQDLVQLMDLYRIQREGT